MGSSAIKRGLEHFIKRGLCRLEPSPTGALLTSRKNATSALSRTDDHAQDGDVRWVFLGAPGVGKGTYCSRLGKYLGVPHISMGDLVRDELKKGSRLAAQMEDITSRGLLLPDEVVLELLALRLHKGSQRGEPGFILDGFPRTTSQAAALDNVTPIDLAVNFTLREDVLMTKLLGRRMCNECGGNFNVADIQIPPSQSSPGIVMPPLSPPQACVDKMSVRADDNEEVVRSRLQVYYKESKPVEDFYRARGQLLEFEIQGGIPETWPRLLQALGISERPEIEPEPEDDYPLSQAG